MSRSVPFLAPGGYNDTIVRKEQHLIAVTDKDAQIGTFTQNPVPLLCSKSANDLLCASFLESRLSIDIYIGKRRNLEVNTPTMLAKGNKYQHPKRTTPLAINNENW